MVSLPIINKKNYNVKDLGENGGHKKKTRSTVQLVQYDTRVFWHPVTSNKNLWTHSISVAKINPEYSDILYNLSHFPGPLVCRIRQVPLYIDVPGEVMQVKCMLMEKGFKINLYSKTHLSRMQ